MSKLYELLEYVDVTVSSAEKGRASTRPLWKLKLRDSFGEEHAAIYYGSSHIDPHSLAGMRLRVPDSALTYKSIIFLRAVDIVAPAVSHKSEIIFGCVTRASPSDEHYLCNLDDGVRITFGFSKECVLSGTIGFFAIEPLRDGLIELHLVDT